MGAVVRIDRLPDEVVAPSQAARSDSELAALEQGRGSVVALKGTVQVGGDTRVVQTLHGVVEVDSPPARSCALENEGALTCLLRLMMGEEPPSQGDRVGQETLSDQLGRL